MSTRPCSISSNSLSISNACRRFITGQPPRSQHGIGPCLGCLMMHPSFAHWIWNPCCTRKSLYGHPQAGRLWQEYLEARIHELHGIPVEGFASNYVFHVQGHTLLLNVYVDDLTLSGAAHLHTSIWQQFQAKIKVEEPQMLKSDAPADILGRLHCLFCCRQACQ